MTGLSEIQTSSDFRHSLYSEFVFSKVQFQVKLKNLPKKLRALLSDSLKLTYVANCD